MVESSTEFAKHSTQIGLPASAQKQSGRREDGRGPGASRRTRSLLAVVTATVLISLNANGTRLNSVLAATTHSVEATVPTQNEAVTNSPVELPPTLQSEFDHLKDREQNASPRPSAQLAPVGQQSAKPVGLFQTESCIDPHPGYPQTRQQQVDSCHTQIWLTYNDGCAGYRVVPSPGANCPNAQPSSDAITWTKCVAKHSA